MLPPLRWKLERGEELERSERERLPEMEDLLREGLLRNDRPMLEELRLLRERMLGALLPMREDPREKDEEERLDRPKLLLPRDDRPKLLLPRDDRPKLLRPDDRPAELLPPREPPRR
jgi:hypothetical protein